MQEVKQNILPVVQNGSLVGLLTIDNIAELLMIKRAKKHEKLPSQFNRLCEKTQKKHPRQEKLVSLLPRFNDFLHYCR